jgi:ribosomal protein L11 methyltransferase
MARVLRVTVRAGEAELVADRLWQLGATGIEERPDELLASFPTDAAADTVAPELPDAEVVSIDDAEWHDTWRQHAEPVDVGRRLRVSPAWKDVPVGRGGDGRVVLRIDPGQCFGGGNHPTTRMLLAQIDGRLEPGKTSVLDIGTGSGVLAVAAARLGAPSVVAVDIDPNAVRVTLANAEANGVEDTIDVSTTPIEAVAGQFDLVLANLSAATLVGLAPSLIHAVAPGGAVLLSGLLPGQWQHVQPAFGELTIEAIIELDGWLAVVLRR